MSGFYIDTFTFSIFVEVEFLDILNRVFYGFTWLGANSLFLQIT